MSFFNKSSTGKQSQQTSSKPVWEYGESGKLADAFINRGNEYMNQGPSQGSRVGQNTMMSLAQNNPDWSVNPQLQSALDANSAMSENQLGQALNQARSQYYRAPAGRAAMGIDNAVSENNLARNQFNTQAMLGQYNQDLARMGTAAGNLLSQDNAEMARYLQMLSMAKGTKGASTGSSSSSSSDPLGTIGGLLGGAGGLATGLGFMGFSDKRLKKDIKKVGELAKDVALYSFNYLWTSAPILGVMADELLDTHPDCVHNVGPFLGVDYGRLFNELSAQ